MYSWKGIKVRKQNIHGVITSDYEGFLHRVLHIKYEDGSTGFIQLNVGALDSGDLNIEWFDEINQNWHLLGDHN